uniref:Golgin-45 n=1 Tax=Ceratitis capitata TaxID=7213 RepID=W8BLV3_CERCA
MESIICDLERHRTRGDGMEEEQLNGNKEIVIQNENDGNRQIGHRATSANVAEYVHRKTSTNSLLPLPGLHSLYRRSEGGSRRLAPVTPKGELIQMTPHLAKPATRISKHQISNVPKFIPYEPYPGATIPIVSSGVTKKELTKVEKVDKNNLDIGILVGQMSTLRTQELDEKNRIKTESSTALDQKLEKLTEDLRRTKEERDYFQGQFRFQTQVNSELKNLLIASVGEDLQTHVNGLTEDKLQLARALLDTANNLTTHTVNTYMHIIYIRQFFANE